MAEKIIKGPQDLYEHSRIVVDPGQSPIRLDKFLVTKIERTSRSRLQQLIKAGGVIVNDVAAKANYLVQPKDVIMVYMPQGPNHSETIKKQDIPLDIRYEDDDLLIVHKPAGMVVHPGISVYDGTLVNALAYYLSNLNLPVMPGNLVDRPGLVHRIDKNTTGLMVVAKTEAAMTHLAKQFFDHTIERRYQALIWGQPEELEGTIEGNIGRHPRFRDKMTVFAEDEGGKAAITHYKVIEQMYYVSLVECKLETGRTHQIRVHMKHIGHPLFNDDRYDGNRVVKGTVFSKYKSFVENCFKMIPRHALHAKSLGFIHPNTGEKMHFESDLPEDMQSVLDKWRIYLSGRKELL